MSYEELLIEADRLGLRAKELPLEADDGLIYKNRIAIRKNIPTLREKACVLSEELGHYYTSAGDILDQSFTSNQKQEYKARLWAYDKQIGLDGIISAYENGCQNLYEMAEHLDVTEEFLLEALQCYKSKYGVNVSINNYIIYFEPYLGVMKMIC